MTILDTIVAHKRIEQASKLEQVSLAEIERQARAATPPRDFHRALTRQADELPHVIAEIKRASPSKGLLRPGLDPALLPRQYQSGGAAALSVLTDARFFQGSAADLQAARAAV